MSKLEICDVCKTSIDLHKSICVKANGKNYHKECHICVQCFRPFAKNNLIFPYEGRSYCEYDFWQLYGPRCGYCFENIVGEAFSAAGKTWHVEHFLCELCEKPLTGNSFAKKSSTPMCDTCFKNLKKKTEKTRYCHKCQEPLDLEFIVIRGLRYHPKHFLCAAPDCKRVLDHSAQEKDNLLYCKSCYHKITVLPTCAACRRVIEGPSRSALGKHWHPEHLVCKKCDMPLLGMLVYEHKGNAYCLTHFTEVAGDVCSFCLAPIMTHKKIKALDKYWCKDHFTCFACDKPLEKFFGVDFRLYCEECFLELPDKVRKQLDQLEALEKKYQKQKKKSRAKYYEKYGLEK